MSWFTGKNLFFAINDFFSPKNGAISLGYGIFQTDLAMKAANDVAAICNKFELEAKVRQADFLKQYKDEIGFIDILSHSEALEKLLASNDVNEIITDYLGRYWKIDFCGLIIQNMNDEDALNNHSSSDKFHHDGCGTRLKMFLAIDDESFTTSPTEIVPNSQPKIRWSYKNMERNNPISHSVVFNSTPKSGEFLIFDTNTIHRGVYNSSKKFRKFVRIELSASPMFDLLRGKFGSHDVIFKSNSKLKLRLKGRYKRLEHNQVIRTKSRTRSEDGTWLKINDYA